jgi:cysteine-rich repeat protein
VANSKDVYENGINISMTAMDDPEDSEDCQWIYSEGDAPVCGASAALKIWKFEYLHANISQSTCIPCENNTMAVKFRTNVIVSTVCGSNMTISGLKNAIAPDGKMLISAAEGSSPVDLFRSTCGQVGYGTWDNTKKQLVLMVNRDIDAGSLVSFTFVITNPVKSQECNEIIIYTHGLNNEAHSAVMGQEHGSDCPMRVCASNFTAAYAVQKSSIPCDDNQICLMFSLNSTLSGACSPKLTIFGIPGLPTTTVDGTSFSGRIPEDAFPEGFALSSDKTTIQVAPKNGLAANTNFTLCIKVINYECSREKGIPMQLELNADDSVPVNRSNSVYDHCLSRVVAGLQKNVLYGSIKIGRLQVEENEVVLRHLYRQFFLAAPAAFNDLLPFFVRPNELVLQTMVQSSMAPCAGNTITTTITVLRDVLFRSSPDTPRCQPVISFNFSLCNAGNSLALFNKSSAFPDFATGVSGSSDWFSIVLQASLMANIQYAFSFSLTNPAAGKAAPNILMKLSREQGKCPTDDKLLVLDSAAASDATRPLFVSSWTLENLAISQSSNIPCSQNTLAVEFKPTDVLRTGCALSIIISGLLGTRTSSVPSVTVETKGATVTGIMSVTSWNKNLGTLSLKVNSELSATVYKISFDVTNPSCKQGAQTAAISVTTSRCGNVTRSGTLGSILETIGRTFNTGVRAATVRQSVPYPCANNTITVVFSTSHPLKHECGSSITLTNLHGSLTPDNAGLAVLFTTEAAQFSTPGGWKQTGALNFSVPADIKGETDVALSFTLINPTKRVSCPSVTLAYQCGSSSETDSQEIATISDLPAYVDLSNPTTEDYKPLCIREPDICITGIAETTPFECSQTTLTVTLTSNVPLKAACLLNQKLTVSGITGMLTTFNNNSLSFRRGSTIIGGSTGNWNAATGSLTVTLGVDLEANFDHVLSWSLLHNSSYVPTRVVTISGTAVSSLAPTDQVVMGAECKTILHMSPKVWYINLTQSPPLACTKNLVSICVSTSTPLVNKVPAGAVLDTGCVVGNSNCANWCQNTITVPGMGGMNTVDSLDMPVVDLSPGGSTFKDLGKFKQEPGEFTVTYTGNTEANASYCFRISLQYPNCTTTTVPLTTSSTPMPTTTTPTPTTTPKPEVCGDAERTASEICDDSNANNDDGCSATCTVECGFDLHRGHPEHSGHVHNRPAATDRRRQMRSATTATASMVMGAAAPARLKPGYVCTTPACAQSTCNTVCGDGKKAGTEGCDDGGSVPGDGCSATCTVECGFDCVGAARPLQTRAHRPAATGRNRQMRSATTATASMVMGAAAPARWKPGTTALRQPAIDPHAAQSAETARGLVRRDATMAAPCRATGARQLAQSSAASIAWGQPDHCGHVHIALRRRGEGVR